MTSNDLIGKIQMAYNIFEQVKPRAPSPVNYANYKPYKKRKRNVSPNKKEIRLRSSATQTLPRGQIVKAQELLYLHKIFYKGYGKIHFRAKTVENETNKRKEIVPNKYELFEAQHKYSLIRRRYILHHWLSYWYYKSQKRKGAREQQAILEMEKKRQLLDYSTPEAVVDEKRDQIKQDEQSILVKEELPQDVHLELSMPIAQKTRNLKTPSEIIFDSKLLDGTRFSDKEKTPPRSPKSNTETQATPKSTKSSKKEKEIVESEKVSNSSSTEYYSEDLYSSNPQFSDSENDLIDEANNIMSKLTNQKSGKISQIKPSSSTLREPKLSKGRPAPIDTTPISPTKTNSPFISPRTPNLANTDNLYIPKTPEQEKKSPSPKNTKPQIIFPEKSQQKDNNSPTDDAYLNYTRSLLDRYEKDDEMNEISNQNKKPGNFSDIYNDSNNDTTEMFLDKGHKSPQYTGSSYSSRIDSILRYGKGNSPAKSPKQIKLESSTIFDTASASTPSDPQTNQKFNNDRQKISISMQKGNKLLEEADKLLSEEEEINSEIFDVPQDRVVIPEHEMIKDKVSQMNKIHQKTEKITTQNETIVTQNMKKILKSSKSDFNNKTTELVLSSQSTQSEKVYTLDPARRKKQKTELEEQLERLKKLGVNDSDDSDYDASSSRKIPKCVVSYKDAVEIGDGIPEKNVKKVVYTAIVSSSSDADMVFLELDHDENSSGQTVQEKVEALESPQKPTLF